MGVGSGGQGGPWPPWIFIHGTNIVERGLKVRAIFGVFCYFFGLFSAASPPPSGRGLIVLFSVFLLFFGLFFRWPLPPGNFSADALVHLIFFVHKGLSMKDVRSQKKE